MNDNEASSKGFGAYAHWMSCPKHVRLGILKVASAMPDVISEHGGEVSQSTLDNWLNNNQLEDLPSQVRRLVFYAYKNGEVCNPNEWFSVEQLRAILAQNLQLRRFACPGAVAPFGRQASWDGLNPTS